MDQPDKIKYPSLEPNNKDDDPTFDTSIARYEYTTTKTNNSYRGNTSTKTTTKKGNRSYTAPKSNSSKRNYNSGSSKSNRGSKSSGNSNRRSTKPRK